MIPPQASEKSGGRWKIPMSYRGVQTSPHLIVTSEEFPPKSQGEFLLDIEKPPRAVNVWEFPHLIKFAKIPLFWHSGTILVGFEKRIPVQDMVQDLFEKPNFVSSTKWKKNSPHPMNIPRFCWEIPMFIGGLLPPWISSSPSLDHPHPIYSRDPNVKRWIVDGTSEENLGSHNHTVTMCVPLALRRWTRLCWERRWVLKNALLKQPATNLHLRPWVNKIKLTS